MLQNKCLSQKTHMFLLLKFQPTVFLLGILLCKHWEQIWCWNICPRASNWLLRWLARTRAWCKHTEITTLLNMYIKNIYINQSQLRYLSVQTSSMLLFCFGLALFWFWSVLFFLRAWAKLSEILKDRTQATWLIHYFLLSRTKQVGAVIILSLNNSLKWTTVRSYKRWGALHLAWIPSRLTKIERPICLCGNFSSFHPDSESCENSFQHLRKTHKTALSHVLDHWLRAKIILHLYHILLNIVIYTYIFFL